MNKVLMFMNSASRNGAAGLEQVKAWVHERQHVLLNDGACGDDMLEVIQNLSANTDAVIIGGGDDSVNHALPALMKTGLPLLLIPLGTANNLARTLSIPQSIPEALSLLDTGKVTTVDVGSANGIPFINVIGIGMSAKVNRMVASESKRWLTTFEGRRIRIVTSRSKHVDVDGDIKTRTPVDIEVHACAAKINVPNGPRPALTV